MGLFDFFKKKKAPEPEQGVYIHFEICESSEDIPNEDTWYRMEHWRSQHLLKWAGSYSSDWKNFGQGIGPGIRVAGISRGDRSSKLLTILDKPGFNLTLEKEPDNPVDSKAVKVIAHHEDTAVHIGYLPAGMGKYLQDEPGLASIPQVVFLPHDDYNMGMEIKVLVRSARWRKKNK